MTHVWAMTLVQPYLRINLLGDFCLLEQGKRVTGLRLRSQQLLAFLILHRQTPQSRRRIAGKLWPDSSESQARTNLRKELFELRRGCSCISQILTITQQTLQWLPQIPYELDIEQFEQSLAMAEASEDNQAIEAFEKALNLYQADLWPDCDADWIIPDQERLRHQYVRSLSLITQLFQDMGDIQKAITWGQTWLNAEPLEEAAYQNLMTLHGNKGDRAAALRIYHQCMTTLRTELGIDPSPTTTTIYQQLLMAENSGTKTSQASILGTSAFETAPQPNLRPLSHPQALVEMVGRDDLFQSLEQWLFSPLNTPAPLLLLTGEPGIGKTRLLEALADSAAQHQWLFSWGRAFSAEQLRSYGVWIDLLRELSAKQVQDQRSIQLSHGSGAYSWVDALRLLFPEDWDVASEQHHRSEAGFHHRGQLLDAMVQSLSVAISPEHPLLLLFDDIHWLDEASTTLLHYVFRSLSQGPLRVACTARWQELQDNSAGLAFVQSLQQAQRLQEVVVPPLSVEAVSLLVRPLQTLHQIPEQTPQKIYIDSGGNPLFALEAARANFQESGNLASLIHSRLQRLDGAAQDLLPWAAALGHRFNPDILALAASYPPMQFLIAIEQLEQQKIVCPARLAPVTSADEGNYDFVHDLVRQVAYDQLSEPRRRIIHGQLAKTLKSQMIDDDLASQVAYHAGLAGNHALAAQASSAAAVRSLRVFAFQDVRQLVDQGFHHCQFLPSRDRIILSTQLLRTRVLAGVSAAEASLLENQIQQLLTQMQGLSLAEAELSVRHTLSILHYEQNNLLGVHQQCIKALDLTPPSPRVQAETLAGNGCCLAEIEKEMDRAEAILLEAQSLANSLGLMFSDIPSGLGCVCRYRGQYDQAHSYFQTALQLTRNQQDPMSQGSNLSYLAMLGWDRHQPDVTEAQTLLELSPQLPQGSDAAFAQALIALYAYANHPDKTTQDPVLELTQTLSHLNQLDAQRKVVFVASHATELALEKRHQAVATEYAMMAYQAAKRIDHPNDMAIAIALSLLSAIAIENTDAIQTYGRSLQMIHAQPLSARAQALIQKAQQAGIECLGNDQ